MRLRHQPLQIVDESLAAVLGIFEVTSDVNRFLGADFLTVAAEDAAEFVDLEEQRIAIAVLVFTRHELDAIRRTDSRAETASDALRLPIFGGEHPVRPSPTRRERPFLFRILNRHLVLEEMLQGDCHPAQRRPNIARLRDGTFENLHTDSHQSPASAGEKRANATAASRSFSNSRRSSREY